MEIAQRLGVSKMTVGKWRHRLHHQGRAAGGRTPWPHP
ncbi:MAG: helix-turn-helix domain-containing protein [Synechococcus sp. SB0668_bin_13]|nr:helix-turn-helix domain-containing protein [Synechococcus sp. SB0668_bin_13]MYG63922.1 helix-turn-helix domain-containing protein [Synechococcus sp. SB0675_bin_7]MYK85115.1 helix-turn-helix domain-containing protein [Synechococcus sp. SB0669_bin_7]